MKMIFVRTKFEGFHSYPSAPAGVAFLRHTHRHLFGVELRIEVFHDDRELEFILVKRSLEAMLSEVRREMPSAISCETIASRVREWAVSQYPHPKHTRYVECVVDEDGENGVIVIPDVVFSDEFPEEEDAK